MGKKEKVNILITGCGAPGISGTAYSLKQKNDLIDTYLIGTDINDLAVGKYFCDDFYTIPSFNNIEDYLTELLNICKKHHIHVIVPQNTLELGILSKNKKLFEKINVKLLLSNEQSIEKSNNKFELMKIAEKIKIPYPKYTTVNNITNLEDALKSFGWPKRKVVIKPPLSNGSRGVRIIDESTDLRNDFFNEKPGVLNTNFEMIKLILGDSFDTLLVMEFLDGKEYTVDLLNIDNHQLVIPRSRGSIKSGITFFGIVEENNLIKDFSIKLMNELSLKYCFGFQFKMKDDIPHIIECNPRVQGSMIISTLANANIILNSILFLLNKPLLPMDVKYGTSFTRYWGGISNNKLKVEKI
tara:strand:- start:17106 stop:18170 length:1065 start_codon:yes stop_codon:yes gene_type:complete